MHSTFALALFGAAQLSFAAHMYRPAVARSPQAQSTPGVSSGGSSVGLAGTFPATFTEYGTGDANHSGSCNAGGACGFLNQPGFNAAASPSVFGQGSFKGPGCGKCYRLTPSDNGQGAAIPGAAPIIVKVNNLCPADTNILCNQTQPGEVNQWGAEAHFDLCMDGGAARAFFGPSGAGFGRGSAEEVDCSQFTGAPDQAAN